MSASPAPIPANPMTLDDVRFDAVPRRESQRYTETDSLLDVFEVRPEWHKRALCLGFGSWWSVHLRTFPFSRDQDIIGARKAMCARCPVRSDCAFDNTEDETGLDLPVGVIAGVEIPPESDKRGRRWAVIDLQLISLAREGEPWHQ